MKRDWIYIVVLLVILFVSHSYNVNQDVEIAKAEQRILDREKEIESLVLELKLIGADADYQRTKSNHYAHLLDSIRGVKPVSYPKLDTANSATLQRYFIERYR